METTKATQGHHADAAPIFFFYNGKKFDATGPTMTGAAIKDAIRAQGGTFDPADSLVLEGNGAHESDRIIQDGDPVELAIGHGEGPKHFIGKPPTNFGNEVGMHLSPVEGHFKRLRELHPAASSMTIGDGSFLIHIPGVIVPAGWSKSITNIWFIAPVGYPGAAPDCFWADPDLRLADGRLPQNSSEQMVPGTSTPALWFSWHISRWAPTTHDMRTYVSVIRSRFEQPL
jgi:hypothetical protein